MSSFVRWWVWVFAFAGLLGGQAALGQGAVARGTSPVLMLSDVHLDPFSDPAKVLKLAATPAEQWDTVIATPASATQAKDFADLQEVCHLRGVDTSTVLWRSSLLAMRKQAAGAAFVTVSGDLLAHNFECKFKRSFPTATDADYVRFVGQTIRYVVHGLRVAFPATPVYVAMGNNDSACGDYRDDRNSAFLAEVAKALAEALSPTDRPEMLREFSREGYYNATMPAAFPKGRVIVVDDLFLSAKHGSCEGKPDEAATEGVTNWLQEQLADAREKGQHVWVLGHIPPGVDLYSTLRKLENVCKVEPQMFLENEKLATVLAAYPDVVRLAVFGHSHTDELRLLPGKEDGGVAMKIVSSISPVNGNNPSFMVARVDRATAELRDYTVIAASNLTGVDAEWTREYTYSAVYHQRAFSAAALKAITDGFAADATASKPESAAYLQNLYVGDRSMLLKPFWPEYVCALTHDSAASYAKCVCGK